MVLNTNINRSFIAFIISWFFLVTTTSFQGGCLLVSFFVSRCFFFKAPPPSGGAGEAEAESPVDLVRTGSWEGIQPPFLVALFITLFDILCPYLIFAHIISKLCYLDKMENELKPANLRRKTTNID